MAVARAYSRPRGSIGQELAYRWRIVRVFARTEFKLKYAGSALGYAWSLAKPLVYFAVLWVVFSRIFKTTLPHFGLYLIIGIVLFTYLADTVAVAIPSIVSRGSVLRRIAFPSITIPLGSIASSTLTFLLNCVVVGVFVAIAGEKPQADWLLLIPLLFEYVLFVVGVALTLSALYVRFRDVSQLWEVLATVILYTSAIMYPISILPTWAQNLIGFNPLVQVAQSARHVLLSDEQTLAQTYNTQPAIYPIMIAIGLFVAGFLLHRMEAPRYPEIA